MRAGNKSPFAVITFHNHRMKRGEWTFIWEDPDWPAWRYDLSVIAAPLAAVSRAQGLLHGRLADVGLTLRNQASLAALTEDVLKTSEIEGERLNADSVRSSTARCDAPLTRERLFAWHAALFPTGFSGMSRIQIGAWRNDENGAMQAVSGPIGRQRVHFEAPPADRLNTETTRFLDWLNRDSAVAPVIKSGLAHLWFVTLHPLDDGNGRIARAIGDLLLARADGSPQRFYSLSAQIQSERSAYYDILEQTQHGSLDVTAWLTWFLDALHRAVDNAQHTVDSVLVKTRFWQH